jgi:hypothetical protein
VGWFGVLVAGLTVKVFISYVRSGDQISQEITKELEGAEPAILPLSAGNRGSTCSVSLRTPPGRTPYHNASTR